MIQEKHVLEVVFQKKAVLFAGCLHSDDEKLQLDTDLELKWD